MSAIIDVIIVLIFAFCIFRATKQGFIKATSSIVSIILTMVLMFTFQDGIVSAIKESEIGNGINEKIIQSLNKDVDKESGDINVPEFLEGFVEQTEANIMGTRDEIVDFIAEELTDVCISVITIILLYFFIRIALFFAIKVLDLVFKLPLLRSINKLASVPIGVVNALFVIYILCTLVLLFGTEYTYLFDETIIAKFFYNNNILLKLFM